jgi:hypothetical protein
LVKARWGFGAALCLCLVCPSPGGAKETDSFTHRYEALAFPVGEVDGRPVSDFVLVELNEHNQRSEEGCLSDQARRRLFVKLSYQLGGPIVLTRNQLRPAITRHANRYRPEMSESIYRDFAPWRSVSLGLLTKLGTNMASLFRFDLEQPLIESRGTIALAPDGRLAVLGPEGTHTAPVFRLREKEPTVLVQEGRSYYLLDNGQALVESAGEIRRVVPILVSSDKFSHFFYRGLKLFRRLGAGEAEDLDRVLARSYHQEASFWGSRSTGVAAYGDLVANFQGMRFWIHLLGLGLDGRPLEDPLAGERTAPLVACSSEGRWVQARQPDFRDYLDPAWDEALNCNRMRSQVLLDQVLRRIEDLDEEDDSGRVYSCPVDAGLIAETAAGYGRFAPQIINAEGHSSLRSEKRRRAPSPVTGR